jgi:hypothetical protein
MPSSLSENMWVEAAGAACEEGTVLEVSAWENMAETPVLMGATGVSASPRAGGDQANEVRPQSIGAPGQAALALESLREPGFSPS